MTTEAGSNIGGGSGKKRRYRDDDMMVMESEREEDSEGSNRSKVPNGQAKKRDAKGQTKNFLPQYR
jgi:hypothetical protein